MSTREVSCIETYERLAGVPFCAQDVPWLNKCLNYTSHEKVLRGIRRSSEFPLEDPGRYLFLKGMESVWSLVSKNKYFKANVSGGKIGKKKKRTIAAKSLKSGDAIRAARAALGAESIVVANPEPAKEPTA